MKAHVLQKESLPRKICLFGPGKRYLGGISYYSIRLANALAEKYRVCAVTFDRIVPRFLFPGAERVGKRITDLGFSPDIGSYSGLNWYWGLTICKTIAFLKKEEPDIIILQWWTSSVAHTYILLKVLNGLFFKKKMIMAFHETLDPLENKILPLRIYVKIIYRFLFKALDAYVVHSAHDRELIHRKYGLPSRDIHVVPHGSYNHYVKRIKVEKAPDVCCILYFGLLRPYKGVEYLIRAFDQIPEDEIHRFSLLVVGETWEHYDLPAALINKSRYKTRITFINRYVTDEEVNEAFLKADVAVFPYTRASQSGAAHIAISYGIPVICTDVGGLRESMGTYKGTTFVRPMDAGALCKRLLEVYDIKDKRFPDPHPWEETVFAYETVFNEVLEKI